MNDEPNALAYTNAILWLLKIQVPPTNIVPEPAGGIIVDWRLGPTVQELAFYNSGQIEYMFMLNGKVLTLVQV